MNRRGAESAIDGKCQTPEASDNYLNPSSDGGKGQIRVGSHPNPGESCLKTFPRNGNSNPTSLTTVRNDTILTCSLISHFTR
jgi:hypothetical protein